MEQWPGERFVRPATWGFAASGDRHGGGSTGEQRKCHGAGHAARRQSLTHIQNRCVTAIDAAADDESVGLKLKATEIIVVGGYLRTSVAAANAAATATIIAVGINFFFAYWALPGAQNEHARGGALDYANVNIR